MRQFFLIITFAVSALTNVTFAQQPQRLRAGAAAVDITPKEFPLNMPGGATSERCGSLHFKPPTGSLPHGDDSSIDPSDPKCTTTNEGPIPSLHHDPSISSVTVEWAEGLAPLGGLVDMSVDGGDTVRCLILLGELALGGEFGFPLDDG